jgi:hypothetical protein
MNYGPLSRMRSGWRSVRPSRFACNMKCPKRPENGPRSCANTACARPPISTLSSVNHSSLPIFVSPTGPPGRPVLRSSAPLRRARQAFMNAWIPKTCSANGSAISRMSACCRRDDIRQRFIPHRTRLPIASLRALQAHLCAAARPVFVGNGCANASTSLRSSRPKVRTSELCADAEH